MKDKKKKLRRLLPAVIAVILLFGAFFYYENNAYTVSYYVYSSADMPKELDGMCVVQISDLHNKEFGKDGEKLLDTVSALSPDFIFVTGDVVDSRRKGFEKALRFAEGITDIAPTYYVLGNHEMRLTNPERENFLSQLSDDGFHILRDSHESAEFGGTSFNILGIDDPRHYEETLDKIKDKTPKEKEKMMSEYLKPKIEENIRDGEFNILLSHRPFIFDMYADTDSDMVFSGHAHGGQIRFPGKGAIWAKDHGFFPDYTEGVWEKNGTTMFVSRGLGNSIFPFRVLNRPEIVCVIFKSGDEWLVN